MGGREERREVRKESEGERRIKEKEIERRKREERMGKRQPKGDTFSS